METRTARKVSGQRPNERGLLRRLERAQEKQAARQLEGLPPIPFRDFSAIEPSIKKVRADAHLRRKRLQRVRNGKRACQVGIVALILFVISTLHYESWLTREAAGTAQAFLEAGVVEEWDRGWTQHFSEWLKEAEPTSLFSRDIRLLERKMGRLRGFQLASSHAAWMTHECQLHYELQFENGSALGFFEMLPEEGAWKVDTFCFWAPEWKRL